MPLQNKRNAIIMAAGTSSRFVPLSYEIPKGLLEVKGEILIERQIRQLKDAGIEDITVVTGYKAEQFAYLREGFGVDLVHNEDYYKYNNASSIYCVIDRLFNTYVCSSDNYFPFNVFMEFPATGYYSALFADGETKEYCLQTDVTGDISGVTVGGRDSWYMTGHVYFSEEFSKAFRNLIMKEYEKPETKSGYWEDLYIKHIGDLPKLKIKKYKTHDIEEFDSIDELREFDESYIIDTRSSIIKSIANNMGCEESDLSGFTSIPHDSSMPSFSFMKEGEEYIFDGSKSTITQKA